MEKVILVDEQDVQIGVMDKMAAHVEGKLHRAISVFIFNSRNELLLQQRAHSKYHSPLLWTNTCCSHPRPGEENADAAGRRLVEEMGLFTTLYRSFRFLYRANVGGGLTEYEYDHVFSGFCDDYPIPAVAEVESWKYVSFDALKESITLAPEQYTEWFKIFIRECGDALFNSHHHRADTDTLYTAVNW